MYKRILPAIALLLGCFLSEAQQVTYTRDIAPIIFTHCAECHRDGEIGLFPLTNYTEVSNWGPMIAATTASRFMPPYQADPSYSSLLEENYLTDQEIQDIQTWVNTGMPYGDPSHEPLFPTFPEGSQLGTPDLVLNFATHYTHRGINADEYRIFVLPTGLTEDKQVSAIEMRPGNKKIVHHALFTWDTSGDARALDLATPEYGYTQFGNFGKPEWDLQQFPSYAPGVQQRFFPEGMGQFLPKGSDLLVQMHYAPVAADEDDSSTVHLFFRDTVERQVTQFVMLPATLDEPFWIPADSIKTFHGTFRTDRKVTIISIFPHMHLLGKKWEVFVEHADGDTTPLIRIPDWDFNWQGYFNFERLVVLDSGDVLHGFATYDNRGLNPYNPNNPPQGMGWGENTTDEMYYLGFNFTSYKAGDENLTFPKDTMVLQYPGATSIPGFAMPTNKFFPIYPNPAKDEITLGFSIAEPSTVQFRVYDMSGKLVDEPAKTRLMAAGPHNYEYSMRHLPAGNYLMEINAAGFRESRQFTVAGQD